MDTHESWKPSSPQDRDGRRNCNCGVVDVNDIGMLFAQRTPNCCYGGRNPPQAPFDEWQPVHGDSRRGSECPSRAGDRHPVACSMGVTDEAEDHSFGSAHFQLLDDVEDPHRSSAFPLTLW
jgi:hypothetical protein